MTLMRNSLKFENLKLTSYFFFKCNYLLWNQGKKCASSCYNFKWFFFSTFLPLLCIIRVRLKSCLCIFTGRNENKCAFSDLHEGLLFCWFFYFFKYSRTDVIPVLKDVMLCWHLHCILFIFLKKHIIWVNETTYLHPLGRRKILFATVAH